MSNFLVALQLDKNPTGGFYFDYLKSYSQVSEMVKGVLNGSAHVEVIMSPKGMYDYFTHADNPDKTPYDINDIESGAGFDLEKFLIDQDPEDFVYGLILNNSKPFK